MRDKAGVRTLIYAIRPAVLLTYGGQLAFALALLCLPPLTVSLLCRELSYSWRFASLALLLLLAARSSRRLEEPSHVRRNEGLAITCAAFVISPLLMALALLPAGLSFTDTLFETISGITTTGLTTLAPISGRHTTFLFTRAWMQWYGGLGILVLSIALLMHHHATALPWQQPMPTSENIVSTVRGHALRMLVVYVGLTAIAISVTAFLFGTPLEIVTHALSAISTGGFSIRDDSIAGLGGGGQVALMVVAWLGAVSLPLYYQAWYKGWRTAWRNAELRVFLLLSVAVCMTFKLLYSDTTPAADGWRLAVVLGLSAQSGTGFTNTQVSELAPVLKLLLIYSMLIGGCVGSTAGGIKIYRLLVFYRIGINTLERSATSEHTVVKPRIGEHLLEPEEVQQVLLIGGVMLLTCALSWLPFVAYGYPPLDALFEVVSAVGTVGLSTGITGTELPTGLKYLLCFDMLAGRVEVLALLSLLYPRNWFGQREPLL